MDKRALALLRLRSQRLSGPAGTPEEAVGWMGAIQSQEYGLAKWSIGQRTVAVTDATLDALVAEGRILRTHILRPTWHFVLPADIRWMMALTGPRVEAKTRLRQQSLGLDDGTMSRALDIIRDGLAGGRRLTRRQIGALLAEQGIHADAGRLAYVLMQAELDLVVCSGGLEGKQQTYALLDELVPAAEPVPRDEALAELVRRYFTSHGPSTIADFTWWSGLTVADTRRGLEMCGSELEQLDLDGTTYWLGRAATDGRPDPSPAVHLVQTFDEYVVGYQRTRSVMDVAGLSGPGTWNPNSFSNPALIGGQMAGGWRRTTRNGVLSIEFEPMRTLNGAEQDALQDAVQAHGRFLEMPAQLA